MNFKILIVDDEIDLVNLYSELFASFIEDTFKKTVEADTIQYSYNGFDALKICENTQFSVILCDQSMALLNGDEFVEKLKQGNSKNKDTPILMISGNPQGLFELEKKYKQIKIISKPFNFDEIINALTIFKVI